MVFPEKSPWELSRCRESYKSFNPVRALKILVLRFKVKVAHTQKEKLKMRRLKWTFYQGSYKILHMVSRVFLEVMQLHHQSKQARLILQHNNVWCQYLRHTTWQIGKTLLLQTPSWSCTLYFSVEEAQIYISATSVLDRLDHSNNTYKFFKWLAFPFNVTWSSECLPAGASEQHHRFTGYARKVAELWRLTT